MELKKHYLSPTVDIRQLEAADVITTSGATTPDGGSDSNPGDSDYDLPWP